MTDASSSPDLLRIPAEEEALLLRVQAHLEAQRSLFRRPETYDGDLLALRDELSEARLEDVPALLAQMERLAGISSQRLELQASLVDPASPYFAHLTLREHDRMGTRERDVLIGRMTYIDSRHGVRIVDWRHAPVSQLYYRYAEGDDYEERFGDREVEGTVLTRRTLTILDGKLVRIGSPQGTFVRRDDGTWRIIETRDVHLGGGQGTAKRPRDAAVRGVLGVGADGMQRVDRHLPEISALLDPRQFELISRPDSGLVVIQGGAGSGKTTIGLHRIAYLNFQAPKKFSGDRMLVVTTSEGLVSYTSEVLPSLGVRGVTVSTFPKWAEHQRRIHFPWLTHVRITEDTPSYVSRVKKHPAILHLVEKRAEAVREDPRQRTDPTAPVTAWAEALTDLEALRQAMRESIAPPIPDAELVAAWRWCSDHCPPVAELSPDHPAQRSHAPRSSDDDEGGSSHRDDQDVRGDLGIDGAPTEEGVQMDPEDEALLLRAYQAGRGPLRKGKDRLEFEHLFVDEAQDFSAAELAVLFDVTSERRSITLAGDVSQRLVLDNAFRGWEPLLRDLGIRGVAIEPLRIAYRSTREVLELARDVLGPLADALPPDAPRSGAPVEMFLSPNAGVAVGLLGEAVRTLMLHEPRATVAVLTRYAEQADIYYDGLQRSEVPNLRRIRSFDFGFKPGVEVTEIRQVKGLEYDYVIIADLNASTFPVDDESRHLLHVAATRAAHQLWILSTGTPSKTLPGWLVDHAI